ncbi:hypothetical protein DFH07DRAFT_823856 [Mycena maculata]|uniref:F-box domain-containing protein n=1 Tax=Mycena maculata TaxID=230809 RepID=A0AAD7NC66_9AGAR|nr:hypothetical protein DFH07DRAFT_823856 [Mycena maculata]
MARSWPNLQSLHLEAATSLCHPSRMTLHGLRGFAQHCKDLKKLSVTFDASTVPPLNDPNTIISQASLVWLNVGAATIITDQTAVALFLSDLFPNLPKIDTSPGATY